MASFNKARKGKQGWKKFDRPKFFYYEGVSDRTHLTVMKYSSDRIVMDDKVVSGYLVSGFYKGEPVRKVFEKKSNALKFAKSYMRRHP